MSDPQTGQPTNGSNGSASKQMLAGRCLCGAIHYAVANKFKMGSFVSWP